MAKPDVCFMLQGQDFVFRLPMVETLQYLRSAALVVETIEQDTTEICAIVRIGGHSDFSVSTVDYCLSFERVACFARGNNSQMWCMPMRAAIDYMRETARLLDSATWPEGCEYVLVTIGGDNHFTLVPIIEGEANNG